MDPTPDSQLVRSSPPRLSPALLQYSLSSLKSPKESRFIHAGWPTTQKGGREVTEMLPLFSDSAHQFSSTPAPRLIWAVRSKSSPTDSSKRGTRFFFSSTNFECLFKKNHAYQNKIRETLGPACLKVTFYAQVSVTVLERSKGFFSLQNKKLEFLPSINKSLYFSLAIKLCFLFIAQFMRFYHPNHDNVFFVHVLSLSQSLFWDNHPYYTRKIHTLAEFI